MYRIVDWPIIERAPSLISSLSPQPYLGIDWEWDVRYGRPTILGLSDGNRSVSVSHEAGAPALRQLLANHPQTVLVGHNILTADLPILENLLGSSWPIEQTFDTIIPWWLSNMHLCKTTKKADDEEGARRGRGFMNLWSMCSVATNSANWKDCRGPMCYGPCPEHDVFGYNGTDSIEPILAVPYLKQQMEIYQLQKLYELHRDLMLQFGKAERDGVLTDVRYIDSLREDFEAEKLKIWNSATKTGELPFNPESGNQVKTFFKEFGLEDNQEGTIRSLLEKVDPELAKARLTGEPTMPISPLTGYLADLLDYKELGDGPDRWYAKRYWDEKKGDWKGFVDEEGFVHPHFGPFTSTGRCQCAGPNFQNVLKRRIDRKTGEKVGVRLRRGVIPREGHYFIKGDFKNAENMSYVYLSNPAEYVGVVDRVRRGEDFHLWMASNIGLSAQDEFSLRNGGPREASKTVTHATDYGEGLVLVDPSDIRTPRMRSEIKAGARTVFPNWKFQGKIVTFTGSNLAGRAFGSKTFENRAKALAIAERYIARFPAIRDLQMKITAQVEREHLVHPPHGYVLKSMGYLEDQVKTALATWGQQPVAHHIKLAYLNACAHPKLRPVLMVHDELLCEVPNGVEPKEAKKALEECMEIESPEMPGFRLLSDIVWGKNWGEKNEVK